MKIGSISENRKFENRVAITPEILKKYNSLGLQVNLSKDYALHLGIKDSEYESVGAKLFKDDEEVILNSNAIVQMNILNDENLNKLKKDQILIGVLNSHINETKLKDIISKKVNCFSLELLPRITRAQSMDILSSQANLAGYKAVVDSFSYFRKAIPMMMTAAGTISAAKVLVVGAGVAGLQAIATAKRMGAIVFATDVRQASKEQVESLGGKFLSVEGSENLETESGYAKETSEDFKKKQVELLKETLKKIDIVICTALIPGKKAPTLITEEHVKSMKPGSVIIDLAAENGGNCVSTKLGETAVVDGVSIYGASNITSSISQDASALYSKNLFNFFNLLVNQESNQVDIDWEDEIVVNTLITKDGKIIKEEFMK